MSPKKGKKRKKRKRRKKEKTQKRISKIDYNKIDTKWQKKWEDAKIFEANVDSKRDKFFINIPYPYVNGAPHIGAGFTFIRGDVYARFKRMQGFNVLFPQGFHATGEPIVGAVKRLKEGDKSQKDAFKIYGVTEKDLKNFVEKGPEFVAKFWKKRWIDDLKATGFSIDWRRTFITTNMTPTYSRFIEWQYNTLKKKGYVVQGTHPVVWCPKCESPTGDHDRLEGVGESPIEYTLIKFKLTSGEILSCGTLRPETIYGVTNIWINPNVEYVRAEVDDERWILSESAIKKLEDQLKGIKITDKLKGSELVGKVCENPVTNEQIPVLPAEFCDTEAATGIVMSVPSHAPYDWIGLVDLKSDKEQLKKYKIEKIVKAVEPKSIIKTKGFGEHPAEEMCEKFGIKSQKDRKLEKATEQLYKKEFHTGVCKSNCGPYAGMKVADIKEMLIEDFEDKGIADKMWETTADVICRCKSKCHIKVLENQWFLKFSDPDWKKLAYECINSMKFYPEGARQQFENTVAWLKDKACTRRSGLGTPLPWDKSWIVETLSDSVIYMAYYTIARVIKNKEIAAKQLTDDVFDYIFLEKGDSRKLEKTSGLDKDIIDELKKEFEYFYPFDLRTSGKDLVQNHLTFAIFHHVAIWSKERGWPKAYGVNGYVNVGGEKMSKSKGNFIPLRDLVDKHGADLTRINIAASNENMDDADWREDSVQTYDSRIRYLFDIVPKVKKLKEPEVEKAMRAIDIYLQSRLQQIIKNATDSYENMKFRSATQHALFGLVNEIKWYIERVGELNECSKGLVYESVETAIKLIAPIVPHVAEELWEMMGNNPFLSLQPWPSGKGEKIDKNVLQMEEEYKNTLDDIRQVKKLAGKGIRNLCLYFATEKEFLYFNESREHLKKLGFDKISLFKRGDKETYDPQEKAKRAKYGKPGIYVE